MSLQPNISYHTALSGNLVYFCRFLRQKGIQIGIAEESEVLRALTHIPIAKASNFKEALKIVLIKNQYHWLRFDDYYEEFWEQLSKAVDAKTKELPQQKDTKKKEPTKEAQFESLKNWLNLSPVNDQKEVAAYSGIEVLSKKDFSDLSEDEMKLILRVLQHLTQKLVRNKSRLRKYSKKHKHIDMRRTIHYGMRNGGTIQKIIHSEKKEQHLHLVLLCDVSKSMELYSRFLVHLIYAFQQAHDKIETFVFSTALHRISAILKYNEFSEAFDRISERVPHWSGGTTIGDCLKQFNETYAHRMLNKKTIVLILSDGWDTGAPEIMQTAMRSIHQKSRKLFWLNPLSGNPNFSPEALGLQTALPYIDALAPAHNLESLKTLLKLLKTPRKLANY